jgi:cytochrome c oxidase subunit 2
MSRFLPPAAASHAGTIDLVIVLVHWLMLALFAGWSAYFLWVLWRFRQRRQPVADREGAKGRIALGVEVGVVVAEAALLVAIALPVWFARTSADTPDAGAIVVRVVAEQFVWNVHYPGADNEFGATSQTLVGPSNPIGLDRRSPAGRDDIVVQNQLHLPVGRAVFIQLSSKDVIHSFGIPAMRVKQDAVPGVLAPVHFTPIQEGRFDIVCSQLCGIAHFRMRGLITVESDNAFKAFLANEAALLQ